LKARAARRRRSVNANTEVWDFLKHFHLSRESDIEINSTDHIV
jgi:hypothetical protein